MGAIQVADKLFSIDLSSTDAAMPAGVPFTNLLLASGAGVIKIDGPNSGETGILVPVAAGVPVYVKAVKVYKTGTTAAGIIGGYWGA